MSERATTAMWVKGYMYLISEWNCYTLGVTNQSRCQHNSFHKFIAAYNIQERKSHTSRQRVQNIYFSLLFEIYNVFSRNPKSLINKKC